MLNTSNYKVELWNKQCQIDNWSRETGNLECSVADVGTNCKTTTSNAKSTSKIQTLIVGGHWSWMPYFYTLKKKILGNSVCDLHVFEKRDLTRGWWSCERKNMWFNTQEFFCFISNVKKRTENKRLCCIVCSIAPQDNFLVKSNCKRRFSYAAQKRFFTPFIFSEIIHSCQSEVIIQISFQRLFHSSVANIICSVSMLRCIYQRCRRPHCTPSLICLVSLHTIRPSVRTCWCLGLPPRALYSLPGRKSLLEHISGLSFFLEN